MVAGILSNGHLGLPCRTGLDRKMRAAVMLARHQKAVPVCADGFIKRIVHLGGQIAVLHQDGRAKITLIEPGGSCAGSAEKAAAA